MKIFLDDLRSVSMSHNPNKGLGVIEDFVIVRNDKEFIEMVDENINDILLVSFDHDLACYDYRGNEFTGKTAAEYLIQKCQDVGRNFPDWYVHSDNTSGRQNIIGLIVHYMKVVDGVDTSELMYYHKGYYNGKFI
jgi:hypothetical protein